MIFPSIHLLFWDPLGYSHPPVILQSSYRRPGVVPVSSRCRPGVQGTSRSWSIGSSKSCASFRTSRSSWAGQWLEKPPYGGGDVMLGGMYIYIYMYHMGCKETKLIIWLMFRMSELRFFFGSGDLFHCKRCAARFKFRQMIVPTGRMLTQ